MLNIQKYAAIDIGSNAVRLLISNIIEQPEQQPLFRKNALVRVPVRLGEDVFKNGKISEENVLRMIDTMKAFKLLMKTHKIVKYKATATSAMRESTNAAEIIQKIKDSSGLQIDLIDGEEEARIIAATDIRTYIDVSKTYLYIDVGGGSTEFSLIYLGDKIHSRSFKIGTVRLLQGSYDELVWGEIEKWVKEVTANYDEINVIGSGGNINKIFKLSAKKEGRPLTYFYLSAFFKRLEKLSYEQRIIEMNLNPDRADVIIPATRIFLFSMKWAGAKYIYVPKIGLADGVIKSIYYDQVSSNII